MQSYSLLGEENLILVSDRAALEVSMKAKDQELASTFADNKKLSFQVNEIVSKKTLSRPV